VGPSRPLSPVHAAVLLFSMANERNGRERSAACHLLNYSEGVVIWCAFFYNRDGMAPGYPPYRYVGNWCSAAM